MQLIGHDISDRCTTHTMQIGKNFLDDLCQCGKSLFINEKILRYVIVEIFGLFKK